MASEMDKLLAMVAETFEEGKRDEVLATSIEIYDIFHRRDSAPRMAIASLTYVLGTVLGGEEIPIEKILPLLKAAHEYGLAISPEIRESRRKDKR